MSDHQRATAPFWKLHEAASTRLGDYSAQTAEFIRVGEYALALDDIAGAFLEGDGRMPSDLFAIFAELVAEDDSILRDPEYAAIAELMQKQAAGPPGKY